MVAEAKRERGVLSSEAMTTVRLSLPTVFVLVAVVGAGAFAAGRSTSPPAFSGAPPSPPPQPAGMTAAAFEADDSLPPGHPPMGTAPPAASIEPPAQASSLSWKAPARWESVKSASSMRLATFRVPRTAGDNDDAELSIMQAGGSVDANVERWIGQFDAAGQKTAKRSNRRVGTLDVTIVEVQGTYSGGMGPNASSAAGWALYGAIVSTPDMPHFFKLTGPAKTVASARAEFDALIASLAQR
jgi:hypothetical protein